MLALALFGCAGLSDWAGLGGSADTATDEAFVDGSDEPEGYRVEGVVAFARAVRWPEPAPQWDIEPPAPSKASWEARWKQDGATPGWSGWVGERVCSGAGGGGWRESWLRAAQGASSREPWAHMGSFCDAPDYCRALRASILGAPGRDDDRSALIVAWMACGGAEDAALADDPRMDLGVARQWWTRQALRVRWEAALERPSPRLHAAWEAAVAAGDTEQARDWGRRAADLDPPSAVDAVERWTSGDVSADLADVLWMSVGRVADLRVQAQVADVCARASWVVRPDGQPLHPECADRADDVARLTIRRDLDLDSWVRVSGARAVAWVAEHPEQRGLIGEALARCVDDPAAFGGQVGDCALALAALDRRDAAVRLLRRPPSGDLVEASLRLALARDPRGDRTGARLREIGLAPGGGDDGAVLVTPTDVLLAQGRASRRAWSLYSLAALAGEVLADVRFEEPGDGTDRMSAWADGVHWRFTPGFAGDERAAPALLNTVLAARGSRLRYAVLADGAVVVADVAALEKAAADGYLPITPPASR